MEEKEVKDEAEVKFTYRDLKEEINKLSEDQLDKQVYVCREDSSVKVGYLEITKEDIYRHIDDDEERGTLEELKGMAGDEFELENYELATPKDFPILFEDF